MTGRVRADRCSLGSTSRVIHMVIICDRIEYIASHVRRASCRTEFEYTVFFCIRRIFMAEKRVMTLRLEPELRRRIDGLAKAQRRSRSFIAAEAIRQYIAVNEWQIEEMVFTGTPYIREDRVEVLRVFHTARKRSEEHTSELQSLTNLVCRLLLEKKKKKKITRITNTKKEKSK